LLHLWNLPDCTIALQYTYSSAVTIYIAVQHFLKLLMLYFI
jgi:hypothetical protein